MWKSPGIDSQWGKWKSLSRVWLCDLGLYIPWNSPGQNTGVGSISLLQRIFPTQGSNPGLLHCRQMLYCLSHQGSPGGIKVTLKFIWRFLICRIDTRKYPSKYGITYLWMWKRQKALFYHSLRGTDVPSVPFPSTWVQLFFSKANWVYSL